jgi:hypothetical protein
VDYNSSDASLQIVREQAPSSWRVVQSRHAEFICRDADVELMEIEAEYPNDWKIVLTVAEFLAARDLRSYLETAFTAADGPDDSPSFIRFPSYTMIDGNREDQLPLQTHSPMLCQRSQYFIDPQQPRHWFGITMYARFLHRNLPTKSIIYGSGRHYLLYNGQVLTDHTARDLAGGSDGNRWRLRWKVATDGPFIAKYKWSPWPESVQRTLQIFPKISQVDRAAGTPHTFRSAEELEDERARILRTKYISDFGVMGLGADLFVDMRRTHHQMWAELCHTPPALTLPSYGASDVQVEAGLGVSCSGGDPPGGQERGAEAARTEQLQSSDEFSVEVVYYRAGQKLIENLFVSMRDVLQMRSSGQHSANVEQCSRDFCTDVLEHSDVQGCTGMVYRYIYDWVFDLTLS